MRSKPALPIPIVSALLYLSLVVTLSAQSGADAVEFFEARVRPVLAENCFACHTSSKLGGLEMTSRDALTKGGNSGPAVEPGHPERSLLLKAVNHTHERLKMPPQGKLSDEQISDIAAWIRNGAVWPEALDTRASDDFQVTHEQRNFWSFQPVREPELPRLSNAAEVTPIDRFILAKLEEKNLDAGPSRREAHAPPPRLPRPDRPAADAGASPRLRGKRLPRRIRRSY